MEIDMTKKNFEALAFNISCILNPDHRLSAAVAVAAACTHMNPRFDTNRFFIACRVVNQN
jgi:hypothetical protein